LVESAPQLGEEARVSGCLVIVRRVFKIDVASSCVSPEARISQNNKSAHSVETVILDESDGAGNESRSFRRIRYEAEVTTLGVSPPANAKKDLEVSLLQLEEVQLKYDQGVGLSIPDLE